MKIAICDDEQPSIDQLTGLITKYCSDRSLSIDLFSYTDPAKFVASDLSLYNVVFLDANMGNLNGIEAARSLRSVNRHAILVYVSAFVEYAPWGMKWKHFDI